MQRTLYLMRHCEAASSGLTGDKMRPLTTDGRAAATRMGERLADAGVHQVLVSSAARARQTVTCLALGVPTQDADILYNGPAPTILNHVRELADGVTCALVVGHAPGIPDAVRELCRRHDSDPEAMQILDARFPAGTLARLEFDGDWADLREARLTQAVLP